MAGGLGKRVGERAPARAFDRYERGSAWLRGAGGVRYDDVYDVYAYGIGNASAPKRKFVASFLQVPQNVILLHPFYTRTGVTPTWTRC